MTLVGERDAVATCLGSIDSHYRFDVKDTSVDFCDEWLGRIHGGGHVATEDHVVGELPAVGTLCNHKVVEGAGVGVVSAGVGSELGKTNRVGDGYLVVNVVSIDIALVPHIVYHVCRGGDCGNFLGGTGVATC